MVYGYPMKSKSFTYFTNGKQRRSELLNRSSCKKQENVSSLKKANIAC